MVIRTKALHCESQSSLPLEAILVQVHDKSKHAKAIVFVPFVQLYCFVVRHATRWLAIQVHQLTFVKMTAWNWFRCAMI
jgi:hypothetical protein